MGVYNGTEFVRDAVESILNQTYTNFEFVIFEDCSTDDTLQILRSYNDDRIKIVCNEVNLGLTSCLNLGIQHATGKYIARLDADDIALPTRLEEQITFLEANPSVGLCGSWAVELGNPQHVFTFQVDHKHLSAFLLVDNVMFHSSATLRTKVLKDNGMLFRKEYKYAQDYDLWERMSEVTELAVIPKVLLEYRFTSNQTSVVWNSEQVIEADLVRVRGFEKLIGRKLDDTEQNIVGKRNTGKSSLRESVRFCNHVLQVNRKYDPAALRLAMKKIFLRNLHGRQAKAKTRDLIAVADARFLSLREKASLLWKGLTPKSFL